MKFIATLLATQLPTVFLCAGLVHVTAAPTKPNILFILTDDQRWNTLGCMGDTNILTPNIDRLAQQGVWFQNHFVTTSICCCSRASIFTGQYLRRHRSEEHTSELQSLR